MKTILRNFIYVIRRFKMASILNLLGLGIAFVAFMIIMMQVEYDRNFDKFHQDAEKIFRVDVVGSSWSQALVSRPFARNFTEFSPHIKAGMIMSSWNYSWFFYVEHHKKQIGFREKVQIVSPELLQVFHLDMVEGTDKALEEPASVIIPESMARRLFGGESALDKQLLSSNIAEHPVIVKGVYKDFPRNSTLQNTIYKAIYSKENYDSWDNKNYYFFIRLDNTANPVDVVENFKQNFDIKQFGEDFDLETSGLNMDLRLTALPELHYLEDVSYDSMPKASKQTMMVLFTIAFVILTIAVINFTNFCTALIPMRMKSINTQKVLGNSDTKLRGGLLGETVCISLLAYLISLGLLHLLMKTSLVSFVDADVSFSSHVGLIVCTGGLAILIGILAGLYPASYITSFPPALVLKGSFGLSPRGRRLRSILVGVQFVASFALIIAAIFMYLQNQYMQHAPLGYNKDEVIVVDMNYQLNQKKNTFTNELKEFAEIEDVAYSESLLSSEDRYMGWGKRYNGGGVSFQCLPVSANFLSVMGIELKSGRNFRPEDEQKESGSYIFNQKAASELQLKLNETIEGAEIIGFIPDVKFASFRTEVSPMAFYVWGKYSWEIGQQPYFNHAYVKIKAGSDMRRAMKHIQATLSGINPEYPFVVRFYDEILQQTYEKEQKISSLITLFSMVAIFISIVGVFGLVVFESESRRKEIGIRKVLGSTTEQILVMFNKSYLVILLVCFLLGAPIAWYGVYHWLKNFAYRTPMYFWVFILSFVMISVITFITVTFQNWHVANENPVNHVKDE